MNRVSRERRVGVLTRCAQRRRWWLFSILVIALFAWLPPGPAEAQVTFAQLTNTTGDDGNFRPSINADGTRIAFYSDRDIVPSGNPDGNDEIFLWTQGSGITQITNTTGGFFDSSLSINSNGSRIAFSSDRNLTGSNADGNYEIFLWTQGSGITQITNTTGGSNYEPSINADGTRIAFTSDRNLTGSNADGNYEIFLWTQGSGITQITNTTGFGYFSPSINADGTRIAFTSDGNLIGDNPDGSMEIFLWTQGSGFTQITNTVDGKSEAHSINADGTRIAFRSVTGGKFEIFLWTAGSGLTQITNSTEGNKSSTSINSDGTRIAFESTNNLTGGNADGNTEIFLWTQGVGFTQLTNTSGGNNREPSINANGTRIAIQSSSDLTPGSPGNADGNVEIFVATLTAPPIPDIKANGSDGPLTIPSGANLTVTVALDPGAEIGTPADWWVAATSPFGLYWYTLGGWVRSDAPIRVYGGPLFTLAPYTVLNTTGLPVGTYTLYFGVDLLMNGSLDFGQLHVDSVGVTIQ